MSDDETRELPKPLELFPGMNHVHPVDLGREADEAEARADAEARGEVTPLPGYRPRPRRLPLGAAGEGGVLSRDQPTVTSAATGRTVGGWQALLAILCSQLGVLGMGAVLGAALTDQLHNGETIAAVGVVVGFAGYICAYFLRPPIN